MQEVAKLRALDWAAIARRAEENCASALDKIPALPSDISLEAFIRAATDVGPLDHYKYFGTTAKSMLERVKTSHGIPGARAFLRAVLERMVCIGVNDGQYQRLPSLCAHYHFAQLQRIADDSNANADWLDLADDRFQKEFGIASMRLYVAGSNLIDYRCGIPRSLVLAEGPATAFAKLSAILRLGGFKPYFQGHIHAFHLDALNEEGRNDFYRCCVELYPLHPECLGVFCSSWYYDPALDQISPWLAYLRKVPLAGGAHLFRVWDDDDAIANATAKSRNRRKLHEEGKYLPKAYMFVWGRDDQIKWARAHPRAA